MKGLLQRVVTAIFFGVVMLGGLFGGKHTFVLLFVLITLLCLWEFLSLCLTANDSKTVFRRIIGVGLGMVPILLTTAYQLQWIDASSPFLKQALLLFFPLIFLAFIYELYNEAPLPFNNLGYFALGIVYLGIPFALLLLIAIENGEYSPNIVLGMLLLTWANDSGAYFVGSKIGKTPLFPRISPNKTREGSIGESSTGIARGMGFESVFVEYSTLEWLFIAILVVVFGALGDLVESMLKRSLKIKDSGNFLPGHGGFLDRFDAFIFVIPFVAAFILWFR